MKARFQRALALLLVLVLTLGCIPAVSAVQPNEPVTNPEPAEERHSFRRAPISARSCRETRTQSSKRCSRRPRRTPILSASSWSSTLPP